MTEPGEGIVSWKPLAFDRNDLLTSYQSPPNFGIMIAVPPTVPKLKAKKPQGRLLSRPQEERHLPFRITQRQVSLALMGLALVYAFLSGFHTLFDLDMGWHLATGRYVVQHHAVPSTDILSYTSPGAEWIYPPFAGVFFYGIYSAFGYAGLTWFCALALMTLVALLMQGYSRRESIAAAVLAIIAVPTLAVRMAPRPDLFSHLFFAIFLIQLWRFHRSGAGVSGVEAAHDEGATLARRARHRLWILPAVMLLWVNVHPGFIAGLGILFAYLLVEALEFAFPSRETTLLRLRQAWPALAITLVATLMNPFGFKIFKSALGLAGLQPAATSQAGLGPSIRELWAVPISFPSLAQALDWRNPGSSYWWLAVVAVAVVAFALWRRQLAAALLTAVALYGSIQHVRYQGLFAITTVVVGSTIVPEALAQPRDGSGKSSAKRVGFLRTLAVIATGALCLVTFVRIADLISSHAQVVADSGTLFGPGESWWFPERAAAFIRREKLPGNIWQDYNLGGFTAWRLGPNYGDFIDGRNVDPAVWTELQGFISSPPDSPLWEAESDRRGINILFSPLVRFNGGSPDPTSLCQSHLWRPVYLDEVSIVLLRNRPENRPWLDRFEVNCSTHQFVPPTQASRRELSNFYANSGIALLSLNRIDEAVETLLRGEAISPDDPIIHRSLAIIYEARHQNGDAEREYETALSLRKDEVASWFELGQSYFFHGRFADARPLVSTAAQLTLTPAREYLLLGYIDLALHQPESSLLDFAKAEEAIRYWQGVQNVDPDFFAQVAEGRAQAYLASGEHQRAIESQQEAIRRTPENVSRWQALASIYDTAGQRELAEQARQKAQALSQR